MNIFLDEVDKSWHSSLHDAMRTLDPAYLKHLASSNEWLPGQNNLFKAFSLPKPNVRYILLGESPYPRAQSANGYAFWDNAVDTLWSESGLSKPVNRATSLRNLIKMLLIAHQYLSPDDTSQAAIARIDKSSLIQTLAELFNQLLNDGFLLLNASLVLSDRPKTQEARHWQRFMQCIFGSLKPQQPELILLGKIAEQAAAFNEQTQFKTHRFEHPYNISFIHNSEAQAFFRPFKLLDA
ncbi:MAG: uracil-DNA glycosylase [Gammaproteobacteria bacterium CG11_big_fil_rev_8_21_14_0_20_46_22]|nr:MAG: uracil-DNA glycosylase [Gammaproteobacteria bacterium CG12_big_fil_rev_8_21_14_0_65_46_12]PIR12017.1 MAG: uracil-DNA glycosylase [Gammaproteobacteria bacterium CG11_big_fil_rev_8_21_14_0_20_46_22]